ncbi:MAG: vitamin B12 dependent methionine synthase [Spirochaeta sp.]|nr:vitamin B12 dependent methionine synthase [Spirochaeta sp.]
MTFTDIPFSPSFQDFSKKIGLEKYASMEESIYRLFSEAVQLLKPKAIYKTCFIDEIVDDSLTINGVVFSSRTLSKNLETVERVFCFVATCGTELQGFSIDTGDFMEQFLLDELKEMGLRTAVDFLSKHISETYKVSKIATMNPGSADAHVWPIQQQKQLFSLLGDVQGAVGVTLTESCLMVPNKTVSGLFFPTEIDFDMCQVCTRELCPNRKACLSS